MKTEEQTEYCCGYNTVSGAFHKPGCNGECGFMNPGEAIARRRLQKKIDKSKKKRKAKNNAA